MPNPLDAYFMEKDALGFSPATAGKMKDIASSSLVQFGVGAAIMAAPAVAEKIYNAATKRHSYNQMLQQNPELSYARDENPEQFNNFYNSLYRMNPQFARDPVVAGAYMNQMAANPATAGRVVVESTRGVSTSLPSFGDAWRSGAQAGTKAFGKEYDELTHPKNDGAFAEQERRIKGMELQQKERDLMRKQQDFEGGQRQ